MLLQVLLFLHILAVGGLFAGAGIEMACVFGLRRASTYAQARSALCYVPLVGPIMRTSVLVLLAAGIGMVYGSGTGWQPWIVTSLAFTVFMAAAGGGVNGRRYGEIAAACAAGEGDLSAEICAQRADGLLAFTTALVPSALVAMLFLMTLKPGLSGSLAAVVLALAAAGALSTAFARQQQASAPAGALPQ